MILPVQNQQVPRLPFSPRLQWKIKRTQALKKICHSEIFTNNRVARKILSIIIAISADKLMILTLITS